MITKSKVISIIYYDFYKMHKMGSSKCQAKVVEKNHLISTVYKNFETKKATAHFRSVISKLLQIRVYEKPFVFKMTQFQRRILTIGHFNCFTAWFTRGSKITLSL